MLKANLVLVKDARLTGRAPCSPCRLLPKCAPLLLSSLLLLPDAEGWFPGWELSVLIQSYTATKDTSVNVCSRIRDNKGRVELLWFSPFSSTVSCIKCIKCKKQEQYFNNEKWCINKQWFFQIISVCWPLFLWTNFLQAPNLWSQIKPWPADFNLTLL